MRLSHKYEKSEADEKSGNVTGESKAENLS